MLGKNTEVFNGVVADDKEVGSYFGWSGQEGISEELTFEQKPE